MHNGSLGWKWEELLREKSVSLFHKTPEEAIEAYKTMFPEFGEPDIVWEMTPKAINTVTVAVEKLELKDL